ncbi:MAG: substrate-binding domain-containing protein, partial [Chloroflexota bacterium]
QHLIGKTVLLPLVDREIPGSISASSVHNDHAAGMTAAVRHLLELGHRRIALIGATRETLPSRAREDGLRLAVAERSEAVEVTILEGPLTRERGAEATAVLLDGEEPPTAIVCGSNQLLVGCLQVFNERGVRVGSDVSLVTCDDVPASLVYQPPIASISRDTVGLGRAAAELLLRHLRDGADPETVVLPTAFTSRASCAPATAS